MAAVFKQSKYRSPFSSCSTAHMPVARITWLGLVMLSIMASSLAFNMVFSRMVHHASRHLLHPDLVFSPGQDSSRAVRIRRVYHRRSCLKTNATNQGIRLFVGVLSRPRHITARDVIRTTWGADRRLERLMFFTQRPKDDAIFKELRTEATTMKDLVISSEIYEDYYNITYSVLEIFRTAARMGDAITHVLKTDEDVYVRLSLLLPALDAMPRQWLYAGAPMGEGSVIRTKGIRFVPYSNWESDKPVRYAFGWGYVVTIDIAEEIAAGAAHMIMPGNNLLIIEDVAVGYWVQYIGDEKKVNINYNGSVRISESCGPKDVFYHIKTKPQWETIDCMHRHGGLCC